MKRTDRLTITIAVILFLALAAYLAAYLIRAVNDSAVTAEAVASEFALSAVANGIVIREETVLTSPEAYLDITATEGMRVAAGSPLAIAVSSQQGLVRNARMHELEQQIIRTSAALQELRSAGELSSRDALLTTATQNLASAVARRETKLATSAALNLSALLLNVDSTELSTQRLTALEQELDTMRNSSGGGTVELTAEISGVFSTQVDGYEHLGYADLQNISPSDIQAIITSGRRNASGAYGKLVTDHRWYFAAVMDEQDAGNLAPGRTATLNFGRRYSEDIYAQVVSVSAGERGSVAVVFRCDAALADTLAMRDITAEVIFQRYSGIRLPGQAIQVDEETGQTYVWAITALQLERKDIEILYDGGDFVIVDREPDAGALREGNTIVVSGKELYAGKIME